MKKIILLIGWLALIITACKDLHEKSHEEHHEEAKILITSYSNEFELFAEADPFITGETSGILAHFSHLPGFNPLKEGSVTIHLVVGDDKVSQILERPLRTGIYQFELKPEIEGQGMLIFDIKIGNGRYKLEVPGIMVYNDAQKAAEAASSVKLSGTNNLVFTKEQSWKIDFATGLPEMEAFGQVIRTTAKVTSAQVDEMIITSKTEGIVIFPSDNLLEGGKVYSGKLICTISGSGLAENNSVVRFTEAKSNFEKTKSDYERMKELAKDKIVSEKDLSFIRNQFENAKAVYDNLSRNFTSGGQALTSPMAGFIKQIHVKNGQYVGTGQPIITISKNKTLLLRAEVQPKYASILGSVISGNIRTLHDDQLYTFEQLNGKVLSFGKAANDDNYMLPVNIQIDNTGSLLSGGFVELYLRTVGKTQALTVPNTALLEEQGNFFVLVQVTPELFEKREIKTGATDGLKTEILEGLSPDERIITRGAVLVKLSQASGSLDAHAGHVH